MIDAPHVIGRVQTLPGARFIGMHDRAGSDVSADQRHRVAFSRHDERQGAARRLAGDNNDLALASLLLGERDDRSRSALRFAGFTLPPKYVPSISTVPESSG